MPLPRKVQDGLVSLVASLGTARDKATTTTYVPAVADPLILSAMYRSSWLARKIVDIPVKDAFREWRRWQATADQITRIEATENRLALSRKMTEAYRKARLFGGAALYIAADDADASTPLDPSAVRKGGIRHLTVLDRNIVTPQDIETDPVSPLYGKPRLYTLSGGGAGASVHPTRLVILPGDPVPDGLAVAADAQWGCSALESAESAIRHFDSAHANVASLLFEAKVDILRVPDFMQMVASPEYEERWLKRTALAMQAKSINGTLLLDKDEEYETRTLSFSSLPETLREFMQAAAGAADIPATRLLGQAPAGMSSTGESDLRNYYDRIAADQRTVIGPAMAILDECIIRDALGDRPEEIYPQWSPLWQIGAKELADINHVNAQAALKWSASGLIPQEALERAVINQAIESGTMPGLDQMDESGSDVEGDEGAL